jgi:hypothetical protein
MAILKLGGRVKTLIQKFLEYLAVATTRMICSSYRSTYSRGGFGDS